MHIIRPNGGLSRKWSMALICWCLTVAPVCGNEISTWTPRTDLSSPRLGPTAVVLDGQIYLLGGAEGPLWSGTIAAVEVYDPATDTWTPKADLSRDRAVIAAVALEGKIYAIGGHRGTSNTAVGQTIAEVYDPASDTWTRIADHLGSTGNATVAAVDGKIFVIGGSITLGASESTVSMYDPAADTWAPKARIPLSIHGHRAGVIGGLIYVVGGRSFTDISNRLYVYDPVTDTWTRKADMASGRMQPGVVVWENKLYAIGGLGDGVRKTVEVYDPITDTWSPEVDLPAVNMSMGAAVVEGRIYVFGGRREAEGSSGRGNVDVVTINLALPNVLKATQLAVVAGGATAVLNVEVDLELLPEQPVPILSLDLAAVGGTASLVLTHQGARRYKAQAPFTPPPTNGIVRIPVIFANDSQAPELYFFIPIGVFPAGHLSILDDDMADGWTIEVGGGAEVPVFDASVTSAQGTMAAAFVVDAASFLGWNTQFIPERSVRGFGYTALRFQFHPGDVTGSGLQVGIGDQSVPLLGRLATDIVVDLDRREWQEVVIPLDLLLEPAADIDAVRLSGNLEGTFYIDDMHLVAEDVPEAGTAVMERRDSATPERFRLAQNYPNPFNSGTVIRFALPKNQDVELAIYNLTGQKVVQLVDGFRAAGQYSINWDGRDAADRPLASGLYLYRLQAGTKVETRKLLMVR